MRYYRARIITSLLVSFLLSFFLNKNLFLGSTPKINTQAVASIKNFPVQIISVITMKKVPETKNEEENKPTPMPLPGIPWPPVSTRAPTPTRRPNQPIPTNIVEPTEYIPPTTVPTEPEPTWPDMPTTGPTNPPQSQNKTLAEWGQCLTRNSMVLYTQPGCSACSQQKKELGEALAYITEVSCPQKPDECRSAGVRSTPSWAKNGKVVIPGGTSLEYIAQVSGCQLPN